MVFESDSDSVDERTNSNNNNNRNTKKYIAMSRPGYEVRFSSERSGLIKLHAGHMKHTFKTLNRSGVSSSLFLFNKIILFNFILTMNVIKNKKKNLKF